MCQQVNAGIPTHIMDMHIAYLGCTSSSKHEEQHTMEQSDSGSHVIAEQEEQTDPVSTIHAHYAGDFPDR
jgi:hypothetical protein